jgi:hypothetical protein
MDEGVAAHVNWRELGIALVEPNFRRQRKTASLAVLLNHDLKVTRQAWQNSDNLAAARLEIRIRAPRFGIG